MDFRISYATYAFSPLQRGSRTVDQDSWSMNLTILYKYSIGYLSTVFHNNQEDTFDQKCLIKIRSDETGPTIDKEIDNFKVIGERSVKTQLRTDPDFNKRPNLKQSRNRLLFLLGIDPDLNFEPYSNLVRKFQIGNTP